MNIETPTDRKLAFEEFQSKTIKMLLLDDGPEKARLIEEIADLGADIIAYDVMAETSVTE